MENVITSIPGPIFLIIFTLIATILIIVGYRLVVYPCRRMPINIGNVFESSLKELYHNNELLKRLRNHEEISKGCEKCFFARVCRGGLKCLGYALTGDPFNADPGCWLAEK